MYDPLTEDNFLLFCAKHYDSRLSASTKEFEEDIKRIKYIRKLITRYTNQNDLRERLILNHIIILSNVFPGEVCAKILFFKMNDLAKYIKPFLVFIDRLPLSIRDIGEHEVLNTDLIDMDEGIIEALRRIS